jgi:hypothetical protein
LYLVIFRVVTPTLFSLPTTSPLAQASFRAELAGSACGWPALPTSTGGGLCDGLLPSFLGAAVGWGCCWSLDTSCLLGGVEGAFLWVRAAGTPTGPVVVFGFCGDAQCITGVFHGLHQWWCGGCMRLGQSLDDDVCRRCSLLGGILYYLSSFFVLDFVSGNLPFLEVSFWGIISFLKALQALLGYPISASDLPSSTMTFDGAWCSKLFLLVVFLVGVILSCCSG